MTPALNIMIDRRGRVYEELLKIQADQLDHWMSRIVPLLFDPVFAYILSHNQPAKNSSESHQVWLGQDIIEILRTWPDVPPPYPKPATSIDDVL